MAIVFLAASRALTAQSPGQAFDVASVKSNTSDAPRSVNFPLGAGDVYTPNGGYLSATNVPLINFIAFAYKIQGNQMQALRPQLPDWVVTDRFDIQARVEKDPGKDGMRDLMKSLLADRFKLAVHIETRDTPVLALVLSKPGIFGHRLQRHPEDARCVLDSTSLTATNPGKPPSETIAGGFPALCNGLTWVPPCPSGRACWGARNGTMAFIATSLAGVANLDRPMVDQTGLSGLFDFALEWAPGINSPPDASSLGADEGVSFVDALREQLGIRLRSGTAPLSALVIDHVEHPSAN
ncbi:MAG TPA: TIGR03435 family protein [Bryobacteraceae bacterium]|jgi:uncharacterized protein (TIGR03435 family)